MTLNWLLAVFIFFLKPEMMVIHLRCLGWSIIPTILTVIGLTSLIVIFIYYCWGGLLNNYFRKYQWQAKILGWAWVKKIRDNIEQGKKRWISHLLRHNKSLIFLIIVLPIPLPYLDGAAVLASKIAKIKHGLLLCLIANTIKIILLAILSFWFKT
ncbi:MAG: hypothetical protein KAS12_07425 [Candidatus Aenigmarchaeota archaeon]|nr:hypothetical protein [Candidatus Aenigmarchaeota archaeon]